MESISSAIAGILLFGTLAVLSMYNAVRCDRSLREFKKHGKFQTAEIISYQKRKEKTSVGVRYTTVTRYDITVRIELSPENTVTRTIRTSNFRARKYRSKSRANVAFLQIDGKPAHITDLKIKEDLNSSPEFFLSAVLFIVFSVFFIMNIVGMFA
ncbi:MAG: hypothetical protein K2J73_07330 [Oscillospiraceae bacterium]|nr:hypothetical protein [Oscillospiraceae bacterium]